MVELASDPVAVVDAASTRPLTKAERDSLKAQRKAEQDQLKPALSKLGAQVRSQVQSAYNGIKVSVARKDLLPCEALPGQGGAPRADLKPTNVTSVPYLGVDQVWQDNGYTGAGVKVAIIDTGIDYTHATFGGPGTTEAFEAASKANTSRTDAWFGPAAPRVKGGWDFVGDSYNASDPANSTPKPDANPIDCNGHGTHVAGTTGGGGVTGRRHPLHGPYDATTSEDSCLPGGPGRGAGGGPVRAEGVRLRGLDRRHRRGHRLGRRQRDGRDQHVARIRLRHRRRPGLSGSQQRCRQGNRRGGLRGQRRPQPVSGRFPGRRQRGDQCRGQRLHRDLPRRDAQRRRPGDRGDQRQRRRPRGGTLRRGGPDGRPDHRGGERGPRLRSERRLRRRRAAAPAARPRPAHDRRHHPRHLRPRGPRRVRPAGRRRRRRHDQRQRHPSPVRGDDHRGPRRQRWPLGGVPRHHPVPRRDEQATASR